MKIKAPVIYIVFNEDLCGNDGVDCPFIDCDHKKCGAFDKVLEIGEWKEGEVIPWKRCEACKIWGISMTYQKWATNFGNYKGPNGLRAVRCNVCGGLFPVKELHKSELAIEACPNCSWDGAGKTFPEVREQFIGKATRAAVFNVGKDKNHIISPPPGWKRSEVREDGVLWYNAKKRLAVIASVAVEKDEKLWLHVSCSHSKRMPTYDEMSMVKKIFVGDERYAISVMPPKKHHVNIHKYCLHWWSCIDGHPLPEFSSEGAL